ncbi:unnamed protein product [Nyctereutes procyonoides]|uniref:(raccoon dog) hypothetical protein n=1 Tax=Nyctereutes procyonoides TaxID=34880 RepID=A0A811ZMV0_NYCPR|nr:unnamed protein product [Nyctereutes procyonoides]
MRGRCVAQSCRGRTRQLVGGGRGGAEERRLAGSRRPAGAGAGAVATGLFRAAAGAGRLPRRAGVPGAGGCALRGPLPGHRFRAGSPGPSAGCKQGGALCPPAPGLRGREAGGAGSGGGAGAPAARPPPPRRPAAPPPPPGRPAAPPPPPPRRPPLFLF